MPTKLFAHMSWTTDGRLPMIGSSEQEFLRRFLREVAEKHKVSVFALGIVSDHVHLIVQLPAVVDIPKLTQALKGASARCANKDPSVSKNGIKWAKGYDLRSVSPRSLRSAVDYVQSQPARHPQQAITR